MGADGGDLSCPDSRVAAKFKGEAARFDTPTAIETTGQDLPSLVRSLSLTDASETGERLIKSDHPNNSATV